MLCAYFRAETGQSLQTGMTVLIEVELQYHTLYGLSLSIVGIDPAYTLGEIAQQRQKTIAQLEADGLLEAQRLLPFPTLIRRIAVISSPSAAGYEDFKHQLDSSPYRFETTLFGATMQGEAAESSILAALEEIATNNSQTTSNQALCAQTLKHYDAVVIIRGGGATTDLSCFDSYTLCAVCAQFELPILTGIGHTRDVSVLDMVARESLKTPTAVAEWLIHRLDEQSERIQTLDLRLQRTAERQILLRRHRIELLEQRLAALNPDRIYRRGYSLLTKDGQIIRSVTDLQPGDRITTHLSDGSITSEVITPETPT
jgi:exodeoxyribonuclease VII large subunit